MLRCASGAPSVQSCFPQPETAQIFGWRPCLCPPRPHQQATRSSISRIRSRRVLARCPRTSFRRDCCKRTQLRWARYAIGTDELGQGREWGQERRPAALPPARDIVRRSAALRQLLLTAERDAGNLTSNGGLIALREVERRLDIAGMIAKHIPDRRNPLLITHTYADMSRARMMMAPWTPVASTWPWKVWKRSRMRAAPSASSAMLMQ